jgi:DNA-binding SARP family transcriptional activator
MARARFATPPTPLHLRLTGAPTLTVNGRELALEGLTALLVARLALEGPLPRSVLAAWLWPDVDDGRARANLRQRLLRLKALAGVEWLLGESTLMLAPQVRLTSLEEAGTAPLLDGVRIDEPGTLAQWLETARAAQRLRVLAALAARLAAAEREQRFDDAVALAHQQLAVDPQAEAQHRTLIRLHYLNHDTGQARAAFTRLCDLLQREFSAAPSAETLALMQLVEQGRPAHDHALATPQRVPNAWATALQRPPRMIGRSAELRLLRSALNEGGALLLMGEAGMGKSRLLAEGLEASEALAGVKAQAGDTGIPYATLARLLRRQLQDRKAPSNTALARLLPELLPAPAQALPAAGQGERLRLQSAIEQLFTQAQLLAVVVDDLHFADDASLEMFTALAASDALAHLAWVFTQRPGEGPAAAAALRESLEEAQRLNVIDVAPLNREQLAELVRSLNLPELDASLGTEAVAERLQRHTGGNPMFALETLKQMLLPGLATGSTSSLPQPASVGALIDRRLKQLSPSALGLARVAAIAGPDFSAELAEHVLARPAIDLATDWAELEAAQVLKDDAFAHDLVLDAALRSVPGAVAVRVHAQCAAWLAAHHGEPARVARHWLAGGHAAEAALAFEVAAARAGLASLRHDQAQLLAQAAQAFAQAGQHERQFEALAERITALQEASIDAQALAEAEGLGAFARTDLQRLRATRVFVDLLGQQGQKERSLQLAMPALAQAQRLGDHEELIRLAGPVAASLAMTGRPEQAYDLLLPLRPWVDAEGGDEIRYIWYGYWGGTLGHLGRLRESVAAMDGALAAAERIGRADAIASVLLNRTVPLRTMGRLQQAFESSQRGVALTLDDPQDTTARVLARLMHSREQCSSGRYADALQAYEFLLPRLQEMGGGFWLVAAQTGLAEAWLQLAQYARALQLLQQPDDTTPAWMRAHRQLLRMELAHAMGQPLPQQAITDALVLTEGETFRKSAVGVRALRAAAPEAVLQQAPQWAEMARSHERFGVVQALEVFKARAATALGRYEQAAQAARAALSAQLEGYCPESMYLPELHLVAHQALAAAGAVDEARAALKLGADWVRQHALPQVPAAFIESFLQRNSVNRALLALAAAPG